MIFHYSSPFGFLNIIIRKGRLIYLNWDEADCYGKMVRIFSRFPGDITPDDHEVFSETKRQLDEYFKGERRQFDLPIDVDDTDFRRKVWGKLQKIAYGGTLSYKEVAERCGKRGGARAVANACGANPLAIVIPCHRVVGSEGKLGGYTGGIDKKRGLLAIENEKIFGKKEKLP